MTGGEAAGGAVFLTDCRGIEDRRYGSTLAALLAAGSAGSLILGTRAVLSPDLAEVYLLFQHGALRVKVWVSTMWLTKLPATHLDALLINPENGRACRVIRAALEELLREPAVETGVILLLQFVAILANAIHNSFEILTNILDYLRVSRNEVTVFFCGQNDITYFSWN